MPVTRYEAEPADVEPLGRPLKFEFSGRVAKNRFLKSAMAEDLASWSGKNIKERGIPTKESIELYRRFGEGGWGIIITGNMDIEYDMLDGIGDGIITLEDGFSGPRFDAFQELATAAKAHGSLIIGQMTHPGRQLNVRIRKDTISASALQLPDNMGFSYAAPREANESDIARVIDGFAHAAEYLEKAGFDGIELHGAHGYLLSQFLSEASNKRTDKYGGSLENRMRLILEVAAEVKKRTSPKFIVAIKLNSVEFQENGLKPEESRIMCEKLQEMGFDFIELSGGTHETMGMEYKKESTRKREAYFIEFVEGVVPNLTSTRKIVTGGFKTAAAMTKALEVVDAIGMARAAAQEPRLPNDILSGKVNSAIKPIESLTSDYMVHLMAAASQLRQTSKGWEPSDLSNEKAADTFKNDLGVWFGKMMADGDKLEHHGYADREPGSTTNHLYGEVY